MRVSTGHIGSLGIASGVFFALMYWLWNDWPTSQVRTFCVIDTRKKPVADVELYISDVILMGKTDSEGFAEIDFPDRYAIDELVVRGRERWKTTPGDYRVPEVDHTIVVLPLRPGR